jgi:hypothetical protein
MARRSPIIKRSTGNPYSKRNSNYYKKPSNMDLKIYIPYKKRPKSIFRKTRYSSTTTTDGGGCLAILVIIGFFIGIYILGKMLLNFGWWTPVILGAAGFVLYSIIKQLK